VLGLVIGGVPRAAAAADGWPSVFFPEQRSIQVRDPAQLPQAPIPRSTPPRTVTDTQPYTEPWNLSLDEAIRLALVNARVVRVLTGLTAQASGSTIYDPAITNTTIDQEQGRFDPVFQQENSWNRTETPQVNVDPSNPGNVGISGSRIDDFLNTTRLNKTNVLGGELGLRWTENPQTFRGPDVFPLNPLNRSAVELNYTQPLLQGGGIRANVAPIVIARLNTERSYFQYKDSVQELVRGVIEGYWNLVLARTEVWARRIQVQQAEEAYQREKARMEIAGLANLGNVAQARVTYNQFRANLIQAEANVLDREAALRNLLFLPPGDSRQIIPVSEPTDQRLARDWDALLQLAEQRRPDIVELKLILEADLVRLAQAQNQALPRLDAFALYRWNGLSGEILNGDRISTGAGQFTDWTVGINFAVPLGLRQGRAAVRQQELVILRDRTNLDQGLHAVVHDLALTLRDLDSFYEQYLAFKETRAAALDNLKVQLEEFRVRRVIYLNVLQALTDWGNAVSSEARALISYNVALATLERKTGTILETHGLVFYEERFRAAGPLGLFGHGRWYPKALPPTGSPHRYPANPRQEPAENYFDLRHPAERPAVPEKTPPPDELPPPRRH
jgi:outer membrane protein TolC